MALVWGMMLMTPALSGVTLDEIRRVPKLTPQKFASYFAEFRFERHEFVQGSEQFCLTQSGDCDDYATLAAEILGERGYTTRLIAVRTATDIHVVCYIDEIKGYLDYNNRRFLVRTIGCSPDLGRIAERVAKSLNSTWSSASEFTYRDGSKRMTKTVLRHSPFLAVAAMK